MKLLYLFTGIAVFSIASAGSRVAPVIQTPAQKGNAPIRMADHYAKSLNKGNGTKNFQDVLKAPSNPDSFPLSKASTKDFANYVCSDSTFDTIDTSFPLAGFDGYYTSEIGNLPQLLGSDIGDHYDWYQIRAREGRNTLNIHLSNKSSSDLDIRLYNSDGVVVAFSENSGTVDEFIDVTVQTGFYYVQVSCFSGCNPNSYDLGWDAKEKSSFFDLSTRGLVGTGDYVMVGSFTIQGTQPKGVLIRGIGPTLSLYDVPNVVQNPTLTLYSGQTAIAYNDDWKTEEQNIINAHQYLWGINPSLLDLEPAIYVQLNPGAYTVHLTDPDMDPNAALNGQIQIYDVY